MISTMFTSNKNWFPELPSKTAWFAILALIAVGQLEAQVPRRTISDGPPTIPEPVDGKVHGDDYHHKKKPVEMSKEAKEVDYDRSLFGPDPFYEDKPYDVEEQLKKQLESCL